MAWAKINAPLLRGVSKTLYAEARCSGVGHDTTCPFGFGKLDAAAHQGVATRSEERGSIYQGKFPMDIEEWKRKLEALNEMVGATPVYAARFARELSKQSERT